MYMKSLLCIAIVFMPIFCQNPTKPDRQKIKSTSPFMLQQYMTQSEFQASGLSKLSPEELESLNTWFSSFAVKLYTQLNTTPTSGSVIESRIDGDFSGWDGDTIFKLDNGQIWQQESYAYTYHYAYHPKILIYKSEGSYKMKVDGVDSTITVKRLK